ncbi:hypothetical protein CCACVL1_25970 [Corchorus capsularis]|uniref:Uncharacterized protein n=1 Tax=Corchorus capsularis TaxID=210143 RepID=A0A1R3GGC1_COCAP|nr:hypothetical protein CCACVL1_25970 [Corchorus capsularis]
MANFPSHSVSKITVEFRFAFLT